MAISDITSSTLVYTIVNGDTLSEIAQQCRDVGMNGFSGTSPNTTGVTILMRLNLDIENANRIYIGQKITLQLATGATVTPKTKAVAQRAKITAFGMQSGTTDNTIFATWSWDKPNVDHYEVIWKYSTGDGVAWVGQTADEIYTYSTYGIPNNAIQVTFKVRPISKTYKSKDGKKTLNYWVAEWTSEVKYVVNQKLSPITPDNDNFMDVLSVDTETNRFTALAIIKPASVSPAVTTSGRKEPKSYLNGHSVQFEIRMAGGYIYKTGTIKISNSKMDTTDSNTNSFITNITNGFSGVVSAVKEAIGKFKGTTVSTDKAASISDSASFSCVLTPGQEYNIRYRIFRGVINYSNGSVNYSIGEYSDWYESRFGNFSVALPSTQGIRELHAYKSTSGATIGQDVVRVYWYDIDLSNNNDTVDSYEVQYTDVLGEEGNPNFDEATSISQDEPEIGYKDIFGLSSNIEYFFRIRAVANDTDNNSPWSEYKSLIISSTPSAPTTWASSSVVSMAEQTSVTLYWVHNGGDNSIEYSADLDLIINDKPKILDESNNFIDSESNNYINITKPIDENTTLPVTTTSNYDIMFSNITPVPNNGAKIKWRVRTAGISGDPGDWSEYRMIYVHASPTLTLNISTPMYIDNLETNVSLGDADVYNGDTLMETTLKHFPIRISTRMNEYLSQTPISYYVTVVSKGSYDTRDGIGNIKKVNVGDVIFKKQYDTSKNIMSYDDEDIPFILSATDLELETDITYTLNCTVVMTSGLTGSISKDFKVTFEAENYYPDLEIGYDSSNYTTIMKPFCVSEDGSLTPNTLLSVYRREFDGSFTEIITNLDNEGESYITDPHPSLDLARYRIVSKNKDTGTVSYYDPPGYDIGEQAAIIQWDEKWSTFKYSDEADPENPTWSGELLRLPYNVDISDNHTPEVELIEYIGRSHPVGYYGTQVGHTSTWNMVIQKDDYESLYSLRRLSRWLGNVYVREPSGSGYLANVQVSFSQTHNELVIPITLTITRVEGE